MFKNNSMTITGLLVVLLSAFIEPGDAQTVGAEVTAVIDSVLTLFGIAMAYYGRYRKGDITWYGARKGVVE